MDDLTPLARKIKGALYDAHCYNRTGNIELVNQVAELEEKLTIVQFDNERLYKLLQSHKIDI